MDDFLADKAIWAWGEGEVSEEREVSRCEVKYAGRAVAVGEPRLGYMVDNPAK